MNFVDEQIKSSSERLIDDVENPFLINNEIISLLFENQTVRFKAQGEESFFSQYLRIDDSISLIYTVTAYD